MRAHGLRPAAFMPAAVAATGAELVRERASVGVWESEGGALGRWAPPMHYRQVKARPWARRWGIAAAWRGVPPT
jgi:hypothetical protein